VVVIDGSAKTITATIPVAPGAQGVAVDPSADTVYVAGGDTASVIDGATNTVTATLEVGANAWAVAVDPATGTAYVANNGDNTVSVINGPASAPLAITTNTLPAAAIGTPYTATLAATGGTAPYRFSVSAGSLPAGLMLNQATGVISGTPAVPGSADFTAKVTDSANPAMTATKLLSIAAGGCTRAITGTHRGALTIGKGVTCITAATLRGPLTISRGAIASISGSQISGPLRSSQADVLSVCSTRITGPVSVTTSSGYVLVGDGSPGCGGSTIRGQVSLTGNAGGLELQGNTISGPVRLISNSARGPGADTADLEVEANHIRGPLACWRNTPAPSDGDQPNTITGHITGQCVGLA
jgi:YVTN family beta-propeller protein